MFYVWRQNKHNQNWYREAKGYPVQADAEDQARKYVEQDGDQKIQVKDDTDTVVFETGMVDTTVVVTEEKTGA